MPPCAVIRETATYLPATTVDNRELGPRLGLTETDILQRTGITSRRWAEPHETAATLAGHAGLRLLKKAGVSADTIDQLIVSTTSPDMPFPSTACLVQQRLQLQNASALDIMASCSGFLAALSMARASIICGDAKRIMIICSDVKSRFLDLHDPSTAILFGDGAGATLIEAQPASQPGNTSGGVVGPVILHTDGSRWKHVHMPAGGSRLPLSEATLKDGLHTLKMEGIPLFRMAVTRFCKVINEALQQDGLALGDIRHFVFHQANKRILEAVAKRLKLPEGRVVTTIETYGNTSSASLPITLNRALERGPMASGERILLATFGGGITWGACILRWDTDR